MRMHAYGRTERTVPVGSKNNWLTCPHVGQGTLTAARVPSRLVIRPPPLHCTLTLTGCSQQQQAKSRVRFSSIIPDILLSVERRPWLGSWPTAAAPPRALL